MPDKYDLSITIPVYNEAKVIEKVVTDMHDKVVKQFKGTYELVVLEDGSVDGTKEVLKNLNKKIKFRSVSGVERKGYNRAVKDALSVAQGRYVFISDSGGSHEPTDFFRMFKYLNEYDIISGYKKNRQDSMYRKILSKIFNSYISLLFFHRFYDIDCGFKIYKKKVLDDILPETKILKDCISTEIMLRAYKKGYKIKEIPVIHYKRNLEEVKTFSFKKLPKIVSNLFLDILKLRLKL